MLNRFKEYLLEGKYNEAEEICKKLDECNIRDIIMKFAYETENIGVYSFIRYMIEKSKKTIWIELAIDVMLNPLCFIEGAYNVALFHARQLILIERNIKNLERLIFFYNIPENLLTKEEAKCISKEILKVEPDNEVALSVLML